MRKISPAKPYSGKSWRTAAEHARRSGWMNAAPGAPAQNGSLKPVHTLHAIRAPERITVDGILNDSVWTKAPVERGFIQRDPIEGQEPSERTEIRIVYDDVSIYFGVRLLDREPEKIVRQLSRRDNYSDADCFT